MFEVLVFKGKKKCRMVTKFHAIDKASHGVGGDQPQEVVTYSDLVATSYLSYCYYLFVRVVSYSRSTRTTGRCSWATSGRATSLPSSWKLCSGPPDRCQG